MHSRQVELIDGPLAGMVHEMFEGLPVPEAIGFPEDEANPCGPKHWYGVVSNRGYFVDTCESEGMS